MLWILQTRAWVIHTAYTLLKVVLWVSGRSNWQNTMESCSMDHKADSFYSSTDDCINFEVNDEKVDQLRPFVQPTLMMFIVISVILDVACYRYRWLAVGAGYIECVFFPLQTMIPANYLGNLSPMYIFMIQFFGFLCYYCNNGSLIITGLLTQLFL